MTALDGSCEAVSDACGGNRALCATREWGAGYDDVISAIPSAYPAFFCDGDAPTDEPTCLPSRPGEFAGPQSGDADGDGIGDTEDACPDVFDPIRPIDDGVQPDADGDGVGDVCDDTPLDADMDGDGIENDADNCPFDPNDDQLDTDGDDRGDACDACPDTANPDRGCPQVTTTTTIEDIRTGGVADGSFVDVGTVVVTGVGGSGFTVQDPDDTDGQYAGIDVFTGSAPSVLRDDTLTLQGEVGDYYGEAQLADAVWSTASTPRVVSPDGHHGGRRSRHRSVRRRAGDADRRRGDQRRL